jgi:hypothetical protein
VDDLIEWYLVGVAVSWFWATFWWFVAVRETFSIFDDNMRTLGLRRSIATGTFVKGGNFWTESLLYIFLNGLTGLFSWLDVAGSVVTFALEIRNRSSPPTEVADNLWRLRNLRFSADVLVKIDEDIRRGQLGEHGYASYLLDKAVSEGEAAYWESERTPERKQKAELQTPSKMTSAGD